ncbi:hypothetical protein IE53DRAFT_276585 [Violaceomyces palustris]|uniref:Uncharacterized protein n=1 Tax=Violaceomyces palustris TaxID=1673888 RepID=A0ACD0P319_9BASI|nr:hypothetical protein IE53DRAFT_276585 [Violaceomyces palustris]
MKRLLNRSASDTQLTRTKTGGQTSCSHIIEPVPLFQKRTFGDASSSSLTLDLLASYKPRSFEPIVVALSSETKSPDRRNWESEKRAPLAGPQNAADQDRIHALQMSLVQSALRVMKRQNPPSPNTSCLDSFSGSTPKRSRSKSLEEIKTSHLCESSRSLSGGLFKDDRGLKLLPPKEEPTSDHWINFRPHSTMMSENFPDPKDDEKGEASLCGTDVTLELDPLGLPSALTPDSKLCHAIRLCDEDPANISNYGFNADLSFSHSPLRRQLAELENCGTEHTSSSCCREELALSEIEDLDALLQSYGREGLSPAFGRYDATSNNRSPTLLSHERSSKRLVHSAIRPSKVGMSDLGMESMSKDSNSRVIMGSSGHLSRRRICVHESSKEEDPVRVWCRSTCNGMEDDNISEREEEVHPWELDWLEFDSPHAEHENDVITKGLPGKSENREKIESWDPRFDRDELRKFFLDPRSAGKKGSCLAGCERPGESPTPELTMSATASSNSCGGDDSLFGAFPSEGSIKVLAAPGRILSGKQEDPNHHWQRCGDDTCDECMDAFFQTSGCSDRLFASTPGKKSPTMTAVTPGAWTEYDDCYSSPSPSLQVRKAASSEHSLSLNRYSPRSIQRSLLQTPRSLGERLSLSPNSSILYGTVVNTPGEEPRKKRNPKTGNTMAGVAKDFYASSSSFDSESSPAADKSLRSQGKRPTDPSPPLWLIRG